MTSESVITVFGVLRLVRVHRPSWVPLSSLVASGSRWSLKSHNSVRVEILVSSNACRVLHNTWEVILRNLWSPGCHVWFIFTSQGSGGTCYNEGCVCIDLESPAEIYPSLLSKNISLTKRTKFTQEL